MNILNPLREKLSTRTGEFITALPFPHIVIDDFLDFDLFSAISPSDKTLESNKLGKKFDTAQETNKWISVNVDLPHRVSDLIACLNSATWLDELKELSGIVNLIPTQYGNTKLANYHEMGEGGYLGPHVDHSSDPESGMPHVLNIIVYLSSEWDPQNGGATLFYDSEGREVVAKIEYRPNRAIIFLHTPYSFHCVEKLRRGTGQVRRSLYVDYYSESFTPYKHLKLPFPNRWFRHGTTFKLPKLREYFRLSNASYTRAFIQYKMNSKLSQWF